MSKNTYSGFERKRVVAKAYEVTTVEFFDTTPNYFRVTNHGAGRLYFSANRNPTLVNYDFVCDGDNVKLFTEPHGRDRLYIFNPTGSDCAVDIMSFYADFDPIALAFAGLTLDFSGTSLETSTAITSFNSALPQGNNKIGSVGISGALPAGENKIGKVEVNNLPEDYATNTATTYVGERVEYGNTLSAYLSKHYEKILTGTATSSGVSLVPDDGYRLNEVCFLSNDGENDISVTFIYDNIQQTIIIKAGEVLNNSRCYCDSIKLTGNNVAFRLFATEVKKV